MRRLIKSRLIWMSNVSTVCKCMSEFTWCQKLPDFTLINSYAINGPGTVRCTYQRGTVKVTKLTFVVLNTELSFFENTVDPDQLASYNHATSNFTIYSHETYQDNCQKHKIDSLLLSSRCMKNYMKNCSFLHAHFFEKNESG